LLLRRTLYVPVTGVRLRAIRALRL
jgi:hypothetical protein